MYPLQCYRTHQESVHDIGVESHDPQHVKTFDIGLRAYICMMYADICIVYVRVFVVGVSIVYVRVFVVGVCIVDVRVKSNRLPQAIKVTPFDI